MKTKFVNKIIDYTGAELRSLWIYESFGIMGDATVSFRGSCDIPPEHMVDSEDRRDGSAIYSEDMLHFIHEAFATGMGAMVLRQRLFISLVRDELLRLTGRTSIKRSGDDIYDGGAKVTISIATVSPVSGLFHAGINVSSNNTPVKTRGLRDYGIEPGSFAKSLLGFFKTEMEGVKTAACKSRWVR